MPEPQTQAQASAMSPALAAFLAAERANAPVQPGLSDVAIEGPLGAAPRQASHGAAASTAGDRTMLMAYVWWWFCSPLAAHRFYLRTPQTAFAMLGLFWGGLALGLATGSGIPALFILAWLIWTFVDLFLIPGMVRKANAPAAHLAFT